MNAGAATGPPRASSSAAPVLVPERDLPHEQPEERRDPGERDRLSDALDRSGHARTMNTGVPTSTCSNSHSTCGISIRMQPCEAE